MTGIWASTWAAQKASRTRPGAGCGADGGERGEQGRVVEGPAADGGEPAPASSAGRACRGCGRARAAAARAGGAGLGEPRRSRLRMRCDRRPTSSSGRSSASSSDRRSRSAARRRRGRSRAASSRSRSTEPRKSAGSASTGSARTTAKVSRLTAVSPATARPRSSPPRRASGTAARRRSRRRPARSSQRVAGELGVDHRRPRRRVDRQPLQDPQAGERQRLQQRQQREPAAARSAEVCHEPKHVDQARGDEVERDAGDREPEAVRRMLGRAGADSRLAARDLAPASARSSIARSTRSASGSRRWSLGPVAQAGRRSAVERGQPLRRRRPGGIDEGVLIG